MTEFDIKLRLKLKEHLDLNNKKVYEVANDLGILERTFYDFHSGLRGLNGENSRKLMKYLNLNLELKDKS